MTIGGTFSVLGDEDVNHIVTLLQTCLCVEGGKDGNKIVLFCKASREVRLDDTGGSCGATSWSDVGFTVSQAECCDAKRVVDWAVNCSMTCARIRGGNGLLVKEKMPELGNCGSITARPVIVSDRVRTARFTR